MWLADIIQHLQVKHLLCGARYVLLYLTVAVSLSIIVGTGWGPASPIVALLVGLSAGVGIACPGFRADFSLPVCLCFYFQSSFLAFCVTWLSVYWLFHVSPIYRPCLFIIWRRQWNLAPWRAYLIGNCFLAWMLLLLWCLHRSPTLPSTWYPFWIFLNFELDVCLPHLLSQLRFHAGLHVHACFVILSLPTSGLRTFCPGKYHNSYGR